MAPPPAHIHSDGCFGIEQEVENSNMRLPSTMATQAAILDEKLRSQTTLLAKYKIIWKINKSVPLDIKQLIILRSTSTVEVSHVQGTEFSGDHI